MDAACMPEPLANKQSDFDVKYMHPYRNGILLQGCETEFLLHLLSLTFVFAHAADHA